MWGFVPGQDKGMWATFDSLWQTIFVKPEYFTYSKHSQEYLTLQVWPQTINLCIAKI